MERVQSGFYYGYYKGYFFQVIKAEHPSNMWYWITENDGGHDLFLTKKAAIEAFKDYIDNNKYSQ